MKTRIKYLLLFLCFISISESFAQTKIYISRARFLNASIQVNQLNDIDAKGSSISVRNSGGQSLSLDVTNQFDKKIELKIGFTLGRFRQNIKYFASSDFLSGDFQYNFNSTLMPNSHTVFGELRIGPSLPLRLTDNSKLHLSLNAKVSYINREDQFLDRGIFIEGPDGSMERKFLIGELDFQNDQQMQLGFGSEILYELSASTRPFSMHFGIVGTYTPKPYMIGNIDLVGDEDQLKTSVRAQHNYFGLIIGLGYTLQ